MSPSLDLAAARRLAAAASGLGAREEAATGLEGAAAAIERLSGLQIDTLSVVERAHHHILWTRVPRYAKDQLARLEAEPRRIFEYWTHAAAYLPLADYRFCLPRMERIKRAGHDWKEADATTVDRVRERIRAEGALRVKDFADKGREDMDGVTDGDAPEGGGWWEWKPAKIALEFLFHSGELVSVTREGFQKRYDLAERALPPDLDRSMPSSAEMAAWYVDNAERSLGVFALADVAYLRRELTEGIPAEIEARVAEGRLVELELEGVAGAKTHYATPAGLEAAEAFAARARAFVLSPFDPFLIDRRRLKRFFGVDYGIECYLPAAKRSFGYFALPLVYRDPAGDLSFAGLLDAKADRRAGILRLHRLAVGDLAPARRSSFAAALATELRRFALFNGCHTIEVGSLEAKDERLLAQLRERLA